MPYNVEYNSDMFTYGSDRVTYEGCKDKIKYYIDKSEVYTKKIDESFTKKTGIYTAWKKPSL